MPAVSAQPAPLWEHCRRALEHAWRLGPHELPLFGTGDWNDGMNRVGMEGRGESVWLAWFLCDVMRSFAGLAEKRESGGTLAATWRERSHAARQCAGTVGLGRRMVSARVLRQRRAARVASEPGGADRFAAAVMGGDFRVRAIPHGRGGRWNRHRAIW